MAILQNLNLLIAFILELGMLVAYGYWGFHLPVNTALRFTISIAVPLIIILLWGFFAAPNSATQLHQPLLVIFQFAIFSIAAALLFASQQRLLAIILMITWVVSTVLTFMWHQ